MKRIVIYGNCQAEALAMILKEDLNARDAFEIVYVRSYDHPAGPDAQLGPDDLAGAAVLWEQHDRHPFPYRELLPGDCPAITFPSIDFNLLWPFTCVNPYDRPEPPAYPFGRFPYGDRTIVAAIDQGLSAEVVLQYYLNSWQQFQVDLDRLYQLERARLAARESKCDLKIADEIFLRFRYERLFWTPDHPTSPLLRQMLRSLIDASASFDADFSLLDPEQTIIFRFPPEGPLGIVSLPIHPKVAEHYRLRWYDSSAKHQSYDSKEYSSIEYFDALIRHSIAFKTAHGLRSAV